MPETSGSETVSTKLRRIAQLAKEDPMRVLTSLSHHIDVEFLREAYRLTRKDGAAGVDGQSAEDFAADLDNNLRELLEGLKSGRYRAPPVRRVVREARGTLQLLRGDEQQHVTEAVLVVRRACVAPLARPAEPTRIHELAAVPTTPGNVPLAETAFGVGSRQVANLWPEEPDALCGEPAYVVRRAEAPVVLGLEAGAGHIIRGATPAYREARKDISPLSVCQLGERLGAGSEPLTAHVSSAWAFISRSTWA